MSNDKLPQLSEKVGSVRNLISNFESSNQQNCTNLEQSKTDQQDIDFLDINESHVTEISEGNLQELSVKSNGENYDFEQSCASDDKKQILEANNEMKIEASNGNSTESSNNSGEYVEETTIEETSDNESKSILSEHPTQVELSYVAKSNNEISSSVYSDQKNTIGENNFEVHKSLLPIANNETSGLESLDSRETSDWDSGNFLEQFGIESKTNDFVDFDSPSKQVVFSNSNQYNNEVRTLSNSVKSKGSTMKSFVDMSWNLGDIDALEKITKESKSQQVSPSEKNGGLENNVYRKRSVSFNEEKNDIYYLDPNADEKNSMDNNPWKYVCYGILIAVLSFYVITITFKEFVTQQKPTILVTESDVLGFFNGSSNHTRDYILNKLMQEYEMTPLETMLPIARPRRTSYSPRHDDDKIKSVYNSFESINSSFQEDYEIRELMEDDNLKFMFAGMAYAPENVIEPECGDLS